MYLWGFLCFLSAFAATGECLECVTCKNVSSESCSVNTTGYCSDGQVCASQLTLSIASGVIGQSFRRSCAPPSECSVLGTYTHDTTLEKVSTTCCSTDLCTPGAPKLPSLNSLPNGVTCPVCTLGSCSADQYMNCSGDLTMCLVTTTQKITGPKSVVSIVRGCASSGLCFRNNQNYTEGDVYTEISYTCTKGINSTASNTTSTPVTSPTQSATDGTSHRRSSLSAFISILFLLMLL